MSTQNRLVRKREAQRILNNLYKNPSNVHIIHYSCESFYDRQEGTSPRVTSIAVRRLASGQTVSFSIHQAAEKNGVPFHEIEERYTEIESCMLEEFFAYVGRHSDFYWLHWNMRDINFGFPALEHRARVLGLEPIHIQDSYKIDLAILLKNIYGNGYAAHPRMLSIVKLNLITDTSFLSGEAEAEAYENREYVKLHLSTLRKVEALAALAQRTEEGSLITASSWWEYNGANITGAVEAVTDSWIFKIAGFIAIVFTLLQGIRML